MRIVIGERLRPFSHLPGVRCILPYSGKIVQIFPTRLRIGEQEILLPIQGPVRPFTIELDLEKGKIVVFGTACKESFRYQIVQQKEKIEIRCDKGKFCFSLDSKAVMEPLPCERLSLGSHKQLDWELVLRRKELSELFPALFRLGQLIPAVVESTRPGTAALLTQCAVRIATGDKPGLQAAFIDLWEAAFEGILAPRLVDEQFQGIVPAEPLSSITSPLILVQEAALLVRSLFIQEEGIVLSLLPSLPPELFFGKLCNVQTAYAACDLEWSKKLLRLCIIRPHQDAEITLKLQRSLKRFRKRTSPKGRGEMVDVNTPLQLKAGVPLYLDRFEK